jgi:hypothetical protein
MGTMISYNLHIGYSKKDAAAKQADLRIDERVHEFLFITSLVNFESFPYIYRIHDFYKDTVYLNSELEHIIEEMNNIQHSVDNLCLIGLSLKLIYLCDLSLQKDMNIYGFSV